MKKAWIIKGETDGLVRYYSVIDTGLEYFTLNIHWANRYATWKDAFKTSCNKVFLGRKRKIICVNINNKSINILDDDSTRMQIIFEAHEEELKKCGNECPITYQFDSLQNLTAF